MPQIPLPADIEWGIEYEYSLPSETPGYHYEETLFCHSSKDSNKEKPLLINGFYGSWTSYAYKIVFKTDSFHYYGHEEDLSKIGEIPEEVIISDENAFRLEATQTTHGIKLEWKNMPKNTKRIEILRYSRDENYIQESRIPISDLDNETYYIDETVTPGQEYDYYLSAYTDVLQVQGKAATITAAGGAGE